MSHFKHQKTLKTKSLLLLCFSLSMSFSAMALDFVSPTRPVEPPIPPEDAEPISNTWVFNGYICEINTGTTLNSTISVEIHSDPACLNTQIGFVSLCTKTVELPCPNENNPGRYGYLYAPELKPALIQTLQQSMHANKKVKVYRLSNTFDYPHYQGPLEFGNKIIFTNLP